MTKTSEKKQKSKAKVMIDWIITIIFICLFVVVLTFQIISNTSAKKNFGVPTVNGHQTLVVLTDSMEPAYKVGSACFVTKGDCRTYEVGNDISFYYAPWSKYMSNPIVTHRIREIIEHPDIDYGRGRFTFVVGGINDDSDQAYQVSGGRTRDCTYQTQEITEQYVLGKVTGNSMFVGKVYSFVSSIWGLLILLLVPALYLIISYGVDLYKNLKHQEEIESAEETNNVSSNVLSSLSEEDRKRLKEELLQELLEEKKNNGNS